AGWLTVKVPVCAKCGPRLQWQRVLRLVRTVVVAGATMGGAAVLFYQWGFRNAALGGISLGVTIAAIVGLIVWEKFHPPEFKIDVALVNVDYDFLARDYAFDFAELNSADCVSVSARKVDAIGVESPAHLWCLAAGGVHTKVPGTRFDRL